MVTKARANEIFREEQLKAKRVGIKVPAELATMPLTFSNSTKALGMCKWKLVEGIRKPYAICLSKYMLDTNEQMIRETLAHEICHAVVPGDGHGIKWRGLCALLNNAYGYHLDRLASPTESDIFRESIKENGGYKYILVCKKCNHEFKYARMGKVVKSPSRYTCGCGGELVRIK